MLQHYSKRYLYYHVLVNNEENVKVLLKQVYIKLCLTCWLTMKKMWIISLPSKTCILKSFSYKWSEIHVSIVYWINIFCIYTSWHFLLLKRSPASCHSFCVILGSCCGVFALRRISQYFSDMICTFFLLSFFYSFFLGGGGEGEWGQINFSSVCYYDVVHN